jgi:hypothetical protein
MVSLIELELQNNAELAQGLQQSRRTHNPDTNLFIGNEVDHVLGGRSGGACPSFDCNAECSARYSSRSATSSDLKVEAMETCGSAARCVRSYRQSLLARPCDAEAANLHIGGTDANQVRRAQRLF